MNKEKNLQKDNHCTDIHKALIDRYNQMYIDIPATKCKYFNGIEKPLNYFYIPQYCF